MTGEMSQFNAEHAAEWTLHRKLAKALNGRVRAFDVYQGPCIEGDFNGRLWLSPYHPSSALIVLCWTRQGVEPLMSEPFHPTQVRKACFEARRMLTAINLRPKN